MSQTTEQEFLQAVKAAVERCPEHAETLSSLSEAHLAKRLYADAYTQLKAQYRELAAEHARLQREQSEVYVKAAMIADFINHMSRRLSRPVESLEKLGRALSESGGDGCAEQAAEVVSTVNRLTHIVTDLVQVAEAIRDDHRTPVAKRNGTAQAGLGERPVVVPLTAEPVLAA